MYAHRDWPQLAVLLLGLLVATPPAGAQSTEYVIGPQDRLMVTVWEQPDLTGAYEVEPDGTLSFPLIGRVTAGGLTVREFEGEIIRLLADGFLNEPQVSVGVEAYRSQRIFVVGEVSSPGTYPLTAEMTLIEAVATAGSTTPSAASEALIVRSHGQIAEAPTLPHESDDDVIAVDIESLQSGDRSKNLQLYDGDTIYVPRADFVYVFGEVNSPGEFPVRAATTVLQALALASGVTEYGATNRIQVIRVIGDQQREIKVKLNDLVQAGDTIVVPKRYF